MNEAIIEAKAPGVFSLEEFLVGTSYPKQNVVIFTDGESANKIIELSELRAKLEIGNKSSKNEPRTVGSEPRSEELVDIDEQIASLNEKVETSLLVFELQGMSPKEVNEVTQKHFVDSSKDYANTPGELARDLELIAKSIVSIKNSNGDVDPNPATPEKIMALKNRILKGEYAKLVQGVSHVNMNGALFDQAVDAPFLSRRINVAG